jgi:DNA-binding transcriptional MerR regulator
MTRAPDEPVRPQAGLYRIHAVAKATGVTEHALRVWERRYGALSSHRSDAGYRLYSDDDVAKIKVIKELIDAGHAIGEIARLPYPELLRLRKALGPEPGPALPEPVAEVARKRFLDAIAAFDPEEGGRVIAAAMVAFPVHELLTRIFAPLLTEIGQRWADGVFSIAQEHAATAVLRGHLGELLRMARPSAIGPVIVASTPEGELHEFGALLASVVAANAGARVLYLGPSMPTTDLAFAVEGAAARIALLSMLCAPPEQVHETLLRYRKAIPKSVQLWVGGAAVSRNPPSGVTWIRSLDEVREMIATGMTRAR